ncbi:MAG: hypothetical protein WC982_05070 [Advenella sp.]
MAKFVCFPTNPQDPDSKPVYINPELVSAVQPANRQGASKVYTGGGEDDCWLVNGSVEEVLTKLGDSSYA